VVLQSLATVSGHREKPRPGCDAACRHSERGEGDPSGEGLQGSPGLLVDFASSGRRTKQVQLTLTLTTVTSRLSSRLYHHCRLYEIEREIPRSPAHPPQTCRLWLEHSRLFSNRARRHTAVSMESDSVHAQRMAISQDVLDHRVAARAAARCQIKLVVDANGRDRSPINSRRGASAPATGTFISSASFGTPPFSSPLCSGLPSLV
jgi:hypothetical protein